jgi:4,4'-diaponeurosporenoate glycosyltransferase
VSCHFALAALLLLTIATTVTGMTFPTAGPWFVWVIAWVALSCQFGAVLRRIGSFSWWTWVLFPVPLLAFGLLFVRSVYLTHVRHAVRWRGRVVTVGGTPERPDRADA